MMIDINEKNPYKILNVTPYTTKKEVKSRYITLMKEYHPDNSSFDKELSETLCKNINNAYAYIIEYAPNNDINSDKHAPATNKANKSQSQDTLDKRSASLKEAWKKRKDKQEQERQARWADTHANDTPAWIIRCRKMTKHFKSDNKLAQNIEFIEKAINDIKGIYILRTLCETIEKMNHSYFDIGLVGVSYDGRMKRIKSESLHNKVWLVREVNNEYDENAILAVNSGGESLGHLPRIVASVLSPLIDNGDITIDEAEVISLAPRSPRIAIRIYISEGNFSSLSQIKNDTIPS